MSRCSVCARSTSSRRFFGSSSTRCGRSGMRDAQRRGWVFSRMSQPPNAALVSQNAQGRSVPGGSYTYNNVARYTRTGGRRSGSEPHPVVDIFACSAVLVPVNYVNFHWALGVIFPQTCEISTPDSIGPGADRVYDHLLHYLQDEHLARKGTPLPGVWRRRLGPWPQQVNGCDCGVCVLQTGELILAEEPIAYLQAGNDAFRRTTLLRCLNGTHEDTVVYLAAAEALRPAAAGGAARGAALAGGAAGGGAAAGAEAAAVAAAAAGGTSARAAAAAVLLTAVGPVAAAARRAAAGAATAGQVHPGAGPQTARSVLPAQPVAARVAARRPQAALAAPSNARGAPAPVRLQGAPRMAAAPLAAHAPPPPAVQAAALAAHPIPPLPRVFTGRSLRAERRARAAEQSARQHRGHRGAAPLLAAAAAPLPAAAAAPLPAPAAAPLPAAAAAPLPAPAAAPLPAAAAPPVASRRRKLRGLWARHDAARHAAAAAALAAGPAPAAPPPPWLDRVRGLKYDRVSRRFVDRDKNSARCIGDVFMWAFVHGPAQRPPYLERRPGRLAPLPVFELRLPAPAQPRAAAAPAPAAAAAPSATF